ncbi:MAG TPA: sulfite exporter TauE/SafE family protein [Thermoanaerobaculia bacterium]|nr:sulfite exporter TauE/SafE family protein [Thermoanaerobaculia bacterium]
MDLIALSWLGAAAIGLSLGLLGAGGSILTVPVLVYLVGQEEKVAIAESLAIVGGIALVGGLIAASERRVHWRSVAYFGAPTMAGTYLGASLARWVHGSVQLAVFAVVMLLAAALMARRPADGALEPRIDLWKIAAQGIAVGMLTGFVGVGGGFLIVPALVLLGGLGMQLAVGTSLLIIALGALTGFVKSTAVLGDLGHAVDWRLIGLFLAIGVIGALAGGRLARRLPQQRLRHAFAVLLLVVGGAMLAQQAPSLIA